MRAQALLTQESAFAQSARLLSPTVGLVSGCIAILVRLKSGWPARHESSAGTHSNTLSQNPRPRHRARRHRLVRGIPLAIGVLLGLFVLLSDGVSAQPPQAAAEVGDGYLEWRSGQFSIVAQFVAIEGENVILHRRDNHQRITVPLKVLDPASQQQARDCHQASLNQMVDSGTKPVEPKSTPTRTDPAELQEVPIPPNTIITGLRQSSPVQRLLALHGEKLDLPESGRETSSTASRRLRRPPEKPDLPETSREITYETVIRNSGKERRTYYLQWQKDGKAEGEIREIVVGPSSEVAAEHTTIFYEPRLPVMGVTVVDESNAETLKGTVESQVTLPLHSASITVLVDRDTATLIEARTGMSVYDWINEQFRVQTELFKNSKSTKHPAGCPLIVRPARIDVLPKAALDKRAALLVRDKEPFIIVDPQCLGSQQAESSSTLAPSARLFYLVDRELGLVPREYRGLVLDFVDWSASRAGGIKVGVMLPAYIPYGYRTQATAYGSNQGAIGGPINLNPLQRAIAESLLPLNEKQVEWLNMRLGDDGSLRPGLPLGFHYINGPIGISLRILLPNGDLDPGCRYGVHLARESHNKRYGEQNYHPWSHGGMEVFLDSKDRYITVATHPPLGRRDALLTPCGVKIERAFPFGYQGAHEPIHAVIQARWSNGKDEVWMIGYNELEGLGGSRNEKNYAQVTLVAGTGMPVVQVGPGKYAIPPQYWQGIDNDNEMAAPGQGAGAKGIRGRN